MRCDCAVLMNCQRTEASYSTGLDYRTMSLLMTLGDLSRSFQLSETSTRPVPGLEKPRHKGLHHFRGVKVMLSLVFELKVCSRFLQSGCTAVKFSVFKNVQNKVQKFEVFRVPVINSLLIGTLLNVIDFWRIVLDCS